MRVNIGGNAYIYTDSVREDTALREGFFALARQVFDLDFAPWHTAGYWDDHYRPHLLLADGAVVACVSVNRMPFFYRGDRREYVQLGTVMTRPDMRGRGLSGALLRRVIDAWKDRCDGMYLYANDTVTDFYPKFGFSPAVEHRCSQAVSGGMGAAEPLDMGREENRALLLSRFRLGNPHSALAMAGNEGLLMFYCARFKKDDVYALPAQDAVAVASYDGEHMLLYDLYGPGETDLGEAVRALARPETRRVTLGFTPLDKMGWTEQPHTGDFTFFVLDGKANPFTREKLTFPLLSNA